MRPIARIIAEVSSTYLVSADDLVSDRRDEPVAWARHVAMWLARELTSFSYPNIAKVFNRDHTTVIHAVRRVYRMREVDAGIKDETDELHKTLINLVTPPSNQPMVMGLALALLAKPASARAASGEQLGLLCTEIVRLSEQLDLESKKETNDETR